MKKLLLNICPKWLYNLYGAVKFWIRFHFSPKGLVSEMFREFLGYDMNWENPCDLNEKINWMKFHYDTTEWTRLADKIAVREYVIERIGEKYLPKNYGIWQSASDIDFDSLPDQFVLKTNHGAGTVLPVLDKSTLDKNSAVKTMAKWANKRYGYETVEFHYLKIKPLIYAEELLKNDYSFSKSLVDFKVYCFAGKAFCILVCTDRTIGAHAHFSYYDPDWSSRPDALSDKLQGTHLDIPKPKCLNEMISCAEKLAEGHPQVRVDFYIVNNTPIFGEMTFTSNGGYDNDITREYSLEMGSKIPISLK